MPSLEKSASWFVRVDGPKSFLTQKCLSLLESVDTKRLLALYHEGEKKDNPHVHFTLETNTIIQKQSFAIRIKKLFEVASKSAYSITSWDLSDSANSYMFHEEAEDIISNKGYTDSDIQRFRNMNIQVQKVVELNKQRAPGRCVERLLNHFKDNDIVPSRADIIELILEWIRDGEMYEPGNFQLEKYMEEVYLKTRPKEQWKDYVDGRVASILRKINF